ncbi:hypothetical protein GO730_38840 [Spirosoma sp. HMF3257]|uniref:hypothetical protein n=1 Tax=Spirosoma telluris TaxID=2183553 RepID=UPI0011B938F1|nr:hypothetical protein [Spirosoma telluris]
MRNQPIQPERGLASAGCFACHHPARSRPAGWLRPRVRPVFDQGAACRAGILALALNRHLIFFVQ